MQLKGLGKLQYNLANLQHGKVQRRQIYITGVACGVFTVRLDMMFTSCCGTSSMETTWRQGIIKNPASAVQMKFGGANFNARNFDETGLEQGAEAFA
jgi:hypothetical protein